ncbi:MAG: hypothetical protein U9N82_06495 [Thermodesulfobacteriota bacterium]|nr:hypothetical protein [Thermodesulfobacteriota bacterium]
MQRSGEEGTFGYEKYRANTLDIEEVIVDVEGKRCIFYLDGIVPSGAIKRDDKL